MSETIQAICFFDLDGTLLNATSGIDEEVILAITQLKKKNVLPIIATGRSILEVKEVMELSGISSIISLNGQFIEVNGEVLYESSFDKEVIDKFLDFTKEIGKGACLYNTYDFWAYEHTDDMKKAYERIHSEMPYTSKTKHEEKEVHMLLALTSELEKDHLYKKEFPELTFFRNGPHSIDITQENNDKSTGVKRIVSALGLDDVQTYGFGDGVNDVPLLKAVDYAIAMGNAIEPLKEIADYVTEKHTNGGIIQALHHYQLL